MRELSVGALSLQVDDIGADDDFFLHHNEESARNAPRGAGSLQGAQTPRIAAGIFTSPKFADLVANIGGKEASALWTVPTPPGWLLLNHYFSCFQVTNPSTWKLLATSPDWLWRDVLDNCARGSVGWRHSI